MRCALADGWGGSMLGTDLTDILFGTPAPVVAEANLGVLEAEHGQYRRPRPRADPLRDDRGRRAGSRADRLRQEQGRQGHQPGRHLLHRQRGPDAPGRQAGRQLPAAGTGHHHRRGRRHGRRCAVHHGGLNPIADRFHTELITTSPKAKIPGSMHIEFDEHHALATAKQIVRDGHRSLRPARRDYHPRRQEPGRARLLARVHRLRAGRRSTGLPSAR